MTTLNLIKPALLKYIEPSIYHAFKDGGSHELVLHQHKDGGSHELALHQHKDGGSHELALNQHKYSVQFIKNAFVVKPTNSSSSAFAKQRAEEMQDTLMRFPELLENRIKNFYDQTRTCLRNYENFTKTLAHINDSREREQIRTLVPKELHSHIDNSLAPNQQTRLKSIETNTKLMFSLMQQAEEERTKEVKQKMENKIEKKMGWMKEMEEMEEERAKVCVSTLNFKEHPIRLLGNQTEVRQSWLDRNKAGEVNQKGRTNGSYTPPLGTYLDVPTDQFSDPLNQAWIQDAIDKDFAFKLETRLSDCVLTAFKLAVDTRNTGGIDTFRATILGLDDSDSSKLFKLKDNKRVLTVYAQELFELASAGYVIRDNKSTDYQVAMPASKAGLLQKMPENYQVFLSEVKEAKAMKQKESHATATSEFTRPTRTPASSPRKAATRCL